MAPVRLGLLSPQSARMSSAEMTPPEAITSQVTAAQISSTAAFTPVQHAVGRRVGADQRPHAHGVGLPARSTARMAVTVTQPLT